MRRYRVRLLSRINDSSAFNVFKRQRAGLTRRGAGEHRDRISQPNRSFWPLGPAADSLRGETETQGRHSLNHGVCSVVDPKTAAAQTRFVMRPEQNEAFP